MAIQSELLGQLTDKEAECAVLGSCMIPDEQGNACDVIIPKLQPTDFLTTDHQLIYIAICNVYNLDKIPDTILVANELNKDDKLSRCGGTDYLYELVSPIVETLSAVHYADIILELSTKRQLINSTAQIINNVADNKSVEYILTDLQNTIDNMQSSNDIEIIPVEDFMQMEFPETDWIVPEILPTGLTVLAAPAKSGKSYFCWNLALAVAQGGMALSKLPIQEPKKVLYLALDDAENLLQKRIHQLSKETSTYENLDVNTDFKGVKFDAMGLRKLEQIIDKHDTKLLIVDTWNHVEPEIQRKGTSYQVDYDAMIPVRRLAHRKNMSIILVTHTRKAPDPFNVWNEIQGSTGSQAGNDTMIMLKKEDDHSVLHVVGRQVIQSEYAIVFDGGIWKLQDNLPDFVEKSSREKIVDCLDGFEEGLPLSEIVNETEMKKGSAAKLLRQMVEDGEIYQPVLKGNYFHLKYKQSLTQ